MKFNVKTEDLIGFKDLSFKKRRKICINYEKKFLVRDMKSETHWKPLFLNKFQNFGLGLSLLKYTDMYNWVCFHNLRLCLLRIRRFSMST